MRSKKAKPADKETELEFLGNSSFEFKFKNSSLRNSSLGNFILEILEFLK